MEGFLFDYDKYSPGTHGRAQGELIDRLTGGAFDEKQYREIKVLFHVEVRGQQARLRIAKLLQRLL